MSRGSWVCFTAMRWFKSGHGTGPSLAPATAGIAVGVAALIIVMGVMNGFQLGFIDAVLEIDSYHIRLEHYTADRQSLIDSLPGIRSAIQFVDIRTVVMSGRGKAEPVRIKILPIDAFDVDTGLHEHIEIQSGQFGGGLLIGSELSRRLNVRTGDMLSVLSVSADPDEGVVTGTEYIPVSGVFHCGFYDFDSSLAFIPAATAHALLRGETWTLGIKLLDRYDDIRVLKLLNQAIPTGMTSFSSWRSYNRSFFGALRMEKTIMLILVGLIFLVVGVNIFHALRKSVHARMEDIATLKALGGNAVQLRSIFMINGATAGLGGATLGLLAGMLIATNINQVFHGLEIIIAFIAALLPGASNRFAFFSPNFFYITSVPVRLPLIEILFIFGAGSLSALVAAWAASKRITELSPAEVLRDE